MGIIQKQSKAYTNSAKPGPTTLRQTRARSQLQHAPPLMRGLDHRGRPAEPLPVDPEQIPYDEVVQKLEKVARERRSAAPAPATPAHGANGSAQSANGGGQQIQTPPQSPNSSGEESRTMTTGSVSQDPLDVKVDEGGPMELDEEPEDIVDWAGTPDTTSQFPLDDEVDDNDNDNDNPPAAMSVVVMVNSEPAQWVSKVPGNEILRRDIAWPGAPAADFLSLDTVESVKECKAGASDAGSSKDAPSLTDTSLPVPISPESDLGGEESPLFVIDGMWDDGLIDVAKEFDYSSSSEERSRKRKRSLSEDDVSPKTVKHIRFKDSKPVKHVRFTDSTKFNEKEPSAEPRAGKADVGRRFKHIYFHAPERKPEPAPLKLPQVNPSGEAWRDDGSEESTISDTAEDSITIEDSDEYEDRDEPTEPSWQTLTAYDPPVRAWETEAVEHAQDKGLSPFGKDGKIRAHPDWYEQYHRLGRDCLEVHGCECFIKIRGPICSLCHDDWLQQWDIFYYDEEHPSEAGQIIENGSTETLAESSKSGSTETLAESSKSTSMETLAESSKSNSETQAPLGGTVRIHPLHESATDS